MAMQSRWDRTRNPTIPQEDCAQRQAVVSIATDGLLDDALRAAAAKHGLTRSQLARDILSRWCIERQLLPRDYKSRVGKPNR